MANWPDPRSTSAGFGSVNVGAASAEFDAGLRSYMLSIYNYMASAVLVTGVVAMLFAPYARDVLISQSGRGMSGLWLDHHACAARFRDGAELRHQPARDQHGTASLLGFRRGHGSVDVDRSSIASTPTPRSRRPSLQRPPRSRVSASMAIRPSATCSAFGTFLIMGVVGILRGVAAEPLVPVDARLRLAISILGVLIFAGLTRL